MGCRACLVTKYVVEYSDSQSFNWLGEELYNLLEDIGVAVSTTGGDGDYYGHWFINFDGKSGDAMLEYIAELKTLPPDEVNKYFVDNDDVTNEYVLSVFEEWLKQSEVSGSSSIRIHWL